MLVKFSVENFKSFNGECTLDLVASSTTEHPHHIVNNKNANKGRLLRAAAIYGANGSGKSNLITAIDFARNLITEGYKTGKSIPVSKFKLSTEDNQNSKFDFVIKVKDKFYNYGFVVNVERIVEEWLYLVYNTREKMLFERTTTPEGKASIDLGSTLANKGSKQYNYLVDYVAVATSANQLFLNEAFSKNYDKLDDVMNWFSKSLEIISPASEYKKLATQCYEDEAFKDFLTRFLQVADTGISNIATEVSDITHDEVFKGMPVEKREEIISHLEDYQFLTNDGAAVKVAKDGTAKLIKLKMLHGTADGKSIPFDLKEESDGTRRIMHLVPALKHLTSKENVFFIDELDRSLHPLLSKLFLETYLDEKSCSMGQLIFTTHETNLLDIDLLRRDEIWFMEKDKDGASHLTSLADFKIRQDLKIDKGYLNGRFGAIPFIGNLSKLGIC